jgi:hypothetical protein
LHRLRAAMVRRANHAFVTLFMEGAETSCLTFPRNHAAAIAAIDLCMVCVSGHDRRQLLWFAVTRPPTANAQPQSPLKYFQEAVFEGRGLTE